MAHQVAVTVLAEVKAGEVEPLKAELDRLGGDERRRLLPFEDLPVHFARFVVLDETTDPDGGLIPAQLIFMSDVDSSFRRYLAQLSW